MTTSLPSPWIVRWAKLVPSGRPVLDVAAGAGRHSTFFAARGHSVTAVERHVAALTPAMDIAAGSKVRVIAADLEDGTPWPLPGETFGGVVVTSYLHRPLFPVLLAAIEPGGVLLYETFMTGQERYGRPTNPAFLLRDGELLDVARAGGLSVVAYEAGPVEEPRPAMVQRIAARREQMP